MDELWPPLSVLFHAVFLVGVGPHASAVLVGYRSSFGRGSLSLCLTPGGGTLEKRANAFYQAGADSGLTHTRQVSLALDFLAFRSLVNDGGCVRNGRVGPRGVSAQHTAQSHEPISGQHPSKSAAGPAKPEPPPILVVRASSLPPLPPPPRGTITAFTVCHTKEPAGW